MGSHPAVSSAEGCRAPCCCAAAVVQEACCCAAAVGAHPALSARASQGASFAASPRAAGLGHGCWVAARVRVRVRSVEISSPPARQTRRGPNSPCRSSMLLSLLFYSDPALAAGLGNPGALRFARHSANRGGPRSDFRRWNRPAGEFRRVKIPPRLRVGEKYWRNLDRGDGCARAPATPGASQKSACSEPAWCVHVGKRRLVTHRYLTRFC